MPASVSTFSVSSSCQEIRTRPGTRMIAGAAYEAVATELVSHLPAKPELIVVGRYYEQRLAAHDAADPHAPSEPGDTVRSSTRRVRRGSCA